MRRETTAIITATEITRTGYFYKYTCSDRSIDLCIIRNGCHELFCVFGDFYASGTQDAEVKRSLLSWLLSIERVRCCGMIAIQIAIEKTFSHFTL